MSTARFLALRDLCALVLIGVLGVFAPLLKAAPDAWEEEITQLTQGDVQSSQKAGAILFLGSSSIRLWKSLPSDFAPMRTVNRGFGGAKTDEVLHFLPRLLAQHAPRQVVLYTGTNDVADGRDANRVVSDIQALCLALRERLPSARLTYIAIAPNPARWHLRETMQVINQRTESWMKTQPNMTFVDVWRKMLDASGQPRPELFVKDQLHMNEIGYALWRTEVASALLPET